MIKARQSTIPFFMYSSTDGTAAVGLTEITVYVSKDGGEATNATNTAQEIDSIAAPGMYKIVLTGSEMDADVIVLTFTHTTASGMPLTISTVEEFPTVAAIQSGLSTLTAADIPTVAAIQSGLSTLTVADIPTVAAIQSGLSTLTVADIPTVAAIQSELSTLTVADIPTPDEIADAILSRDVSHVESTDGGGYSICTLILASLESRLNSDNTWTIFRTDGQTVHITKNVRTADNATPVTGVY